jgi:hypothetical protein
LASVCRMKIILAIYVRGAHALCIAALKYCCEAGAIMITRYINMLTVPKSVGPGRVLCHNHVQHTVDMPCGLNGFRAWTCDAAEKPQGFVKCGCGWSGLPHCALRHLNRTRTSRFVAASLRLPRNMRGGS